MSENIVEVYSKPNCGQCMMLKKILDKDKIEYKSFDSSEDETIVDYLKSLEFQTFPVLMVKSPSGDILDSFSGFNTRKLKEIKELL